MASGDTKTQQYLDIAANGTRADLPSDTCCETRTQTLIRGVAERIMDVEDEVERLENNPDVVDIVDTYADLQAYSTSGLTDKDIIRVIADETKGGLSSYYRWNSPNPGWNFVGVIPGGDGIKELSSADYNYPTADPDRVALWLLDNGLYTAPAGVMVAASTTSYPWYNTSDKTILVGGSDTVKGIYTFLNGKTDVVTTQVSDGTEADEYTLLKSTQVLQATGQSTTDTMSQKAITDAIAASGSSYTAGDGIDITNDVISATNTGKAKVLTTDDYNWPVDNPTYVSAHLLKSGFYTSSGVNIKIAGSYFPSGTFLVSGVQNGYKKVVLFGASGSLSGMVFTVWTLQVSNGAEIDKQFVNFIEDSLSSTRTDASLSAKQGKVLNDKIGSIAIRGAGAPTTSTVGEVGQLYEDGTNGTLYQLKSIDITVTPNTYNWEQVGGSSVNVVQTTGTSTTDVMSQNAVTSMVFADPDTKYKVQIGSSAQANGARSVSIGDGAKANLSGTQSVAIGSEVSSGGAYSVAMGGGGGSGASTTAAAVSSVAIGVGASVSAHSGVGLGGTVSGRGGVAIGRGASASVQGQFDIGSTTTSYGYNDSNYRLLTGLYDPQNAHDAANKEYVDNAILNGGTTAPTTATVGAVGTQYTYVDTTGAPTAHLCVCTEIDTTDPNAPVYTWQTLV